MPSARQTAPSNRKVMDACIEKSATPNTGSEDSGSSVSFHSPAWMILLIGFLSFSSSLYLDHYGGDMSADVYIPGMHRPSLPDIQPPTGKGLFERGAKLYAANCQACHGPSGAGGALVPQLSGSEWVTSDGPNRVIRIVLNAVGGPMEVAGKQFNSESMIPWRDNISDDEDVAAIVTFIRDNKSWGNAASPVTKEQVRKIRDETADRGSMRKWTVPELMAIPDKD